MMIANVLQDAFFAALAAIGFSAISRPPRRAYFYCALIAGIGHALRYILMNPAGASMHIFTATLIAAFFTGCLAVFISPVAKMPAETCLFPSLLPMIPGIYAYKAFGGLAACVVNDSPEAFHRAFYIFAHNGIVCFAVLTAMVVGATIPVFLYKKVSFQATR